MQSSDAQGKIVNSQILESLEGLPSAASVLSAMKEAKAKGAVKHVIANMPEKGSTVEIMGLKYLVRGVSYETGNLHLKLIKEE
jgi:hypothetical protein